MNLLRAFLVVWFVLQFVLPLLPTWGVFLPHGHIARGRVTARDWQAHSENHRNPLSQGTRAAETKIFSVAVGDEIVSVVGETAGFTFENPVMLLLPENFRAQPLAENFFTYALAIPPPNPPPEI